MPGRQAHGRPLLPGSGSKNSKKVKSKARGKALDAFALAQEQVSEDTRGVRTRGLEPETTDRSQKRSRRDDDDEDVEDDDDFEGAEPAGPRKKRARNDDDDSFAGLSDEDSDGNEWHVGVDGEDDDSEIDSDDAFGEGDDEMFEGFAFRGSSSKDVRPRDEDGSDSEDGDSLGSDAIDLAQALDQASDDDEEPEGGSGSGSEEEDESSAESESDDYDEDEEDMDQKDALEALIDGFAGGAQDDVDADKPAPQRRAKVDLKDLGLTGIRDPHMKKALKLMTKEEKGSASGASKKLDVPLAKRQQDKVLRSAAYEKASETLDRWTETVKHNRRADHLFFPLAQNKEDAGLDNRELLPIDKKSSATELEQTIMSIMEESGLGPSSKPKKEEKEGQEGHASISKAELQEIWNQRRRDREMFSREQARSKRVKKIKSKAYRRVHRKEHMRQEMTDKEELVEAGEIDSEDEREAQDRRRAMERMGAKHKESKWAKMGSKVRRAVWDEDYRSGITDMARMDAELRRRVEGKAGATDDDDDDDDDDDESDASNDDGEGGQRERLLKRLDLAEKDGQPPKSGLMQMKFMQRGEEALRKENDELVRQIRRDLASDDEDDGQEEEEVDIGRRQYGTNKEEKGPKRSVSKRASREDSDAAVGATSTAKSGRFQRHEPTNTLPQQDAGPEDLVPSGAGGWSHGSRKERRGKKSSAAHTGDLDLAKSAALATKPAKPKQQPASGAAAGDESSDDGDGDDATHLPMAIKDQDLVRRAFAGEDVAVEFEREKAALAEEDEEKEIDNTLPGWGSWVGEGVSNREKRRHTGRFVTKVEGIKKKDRKDFKLDRVIVSERRVRKNDKYLASQLPHPFESRLQYERSLRLPVGPEWMTKETFQESTKPRVILKPGVIAPMSKPMV